MAPVLSASIDISEKMVTPKGRSLVDSNGARLGASSASESGTGASYGRSITSGPVDPTRRPPLHHARSTRTGRTIKSTVSPTVARASALEARRRARGKTRGGRRRDGHESPAGDEPRRAGGRAGRADHRAP